MMMRGCNQGCGMQMSMMMMRSNYSFGEMSMGVGVEVTRESIAYRHMMSSGLWSRNSTVGGNMFYKWNRFQDRR